MQAKSAKKKVHHKEVAKTSVSARLPSKFTSPDLRFARADNSQCATGAVVPITFIEMSKSRKNDNPLLEGDNVFSLAEEAPSVCMLTK